MKEFPAYYGPIDMTMQEAVRNGRDVAGYRYDLYWIHIGYPQDLQKSWFTTQ